MVRKGHTPEGTRCGLAEYLALARVLQVAPEADFITDEVKYSHRWMSSTPVASPVCSVDVEDSHPQDTLAAQLKFEYYDRGPP